MSRQPPIHVVYLCMPKSCNIMAQEYGIAVVVTNQINSCPKKSNSTGGGVMAYASNYRICLRSKNASDRLVTTIVQNPYHLENKRELILSDKGIEVHNWYQESEKKQKAACPK